MNSGETIRARVALPCSIRLNGSEFRIVRGFTEELTRESLIVVTSSIAGSGWLKASANISVEVELPFAGTVEPRVLECAANIHRVRAFSSGVRIVARVHRMAVISRVPEAHTRCRTVAHSCAAELVPAVTRPQNDNPVIRRNHPTNLSSNLTGENTMSFLKNFIVEEDGQDMVEYGLVIALVVVVGITAFTTLGTKISTGIGSVGTSIAAAL